MSPPLMMQYPMRGGALACQAYINAVLALSPTAYWTMDDDTSASVMSALAGPDGAYIYGGSANSLEQKQSSLLASCEAGSVKFNNTDPGTKSLPRADVAGVGSIQSVAFWIKPITSFFLHNTITRGTPNTNTRWLIYRNNTGRLILSDSGNNRITSTASLSTNNPSFIVIQTESNISKMYINTVIETATFAGDVVGKYGSEQVNIGNWNFTAVNDNRTAAAFLQQISFFPAPLSVSEMNDLYNEGLGV